MCYCIDSALSLRYRTPVIVIANHQEADQLLLSELMDDERMWQKREGKKDVRDPSFFRLRPLHSYTLLQKLAVTKKLTLNGKSLFCDFFTRSSLEFLVENCLVHALLNNKALCEYDLILQGSPHIAISGQKLSFVDPDVSWKELLPFLSGPKQMSRQEYLAFKKEIAPEKLIELDAPQAEDTPKRPEVSLVDATLSFAKLETEFLPFEKDLLKAGFMKKELGISNYYCPTDKSLKSVSELLDAGWKVLDSRGAEIVPISRYQLDLEMKGNFQLSGALYFHDEAVSIALSAKSVQENSRLLSLPSGKSGLLCFESQPALGQALKEFEFVSGFLHRRHLTTLAGLEHIDSPNHTLLQRISLGFDSTKLDQIAPSSDFKGVLRPYQQQGLNWLVALYESGLNGLLADEMGLGKTVQVLAFLSHIKTKTLIIVPTSLLVNWQREIEHFLPDRSLSIYYGSDRSKCLLDNVDIIITSYGTVRSDLDDLKKHKFCCLILDEAQAIKNSSSITFQATLQLQARFRLSLTGTPVENSLSELIAHFRFLEPGLIDDAEDPFSLRKKIAPFFLRRKKQDVAKDLPEKIEEIVYVTPTPEQKLLYDTFLAQIRSGLLKKISVDGLSSHRMEIFEALLRLRQIACHPILISEPAGSGKFDQALQDIDTLQLEGKKVILFSQFTSMLHLLTKEAKSRSWPYLLLEGETTDRQKVVDSFQNDPTYQLLFISLKAGGVGLNLTKADYVLLYDPWWNRAQEAQAIDRAHRIGRVGSVFIKRYIMAGSIEEKIMGLQEKKEKLFEHLFENGAASITLDDLHELLY